MDGIDGVVTSLFKLFWEWRLINYPEFATSVGIHKYDNRLDEMSLNSFMRCENEGRSLLQKAKEARNGNDQLPSNQKMNIDLIIHDLSQLLYGMKFKPYLQPINYLEGPHHRFPELFSMMKRETIDDIKIIINRMRLISQQIDEYISLLREGIRLGLTLHEVSIKALPDLLISFVEKPVLDSPLYKSFNSRPENINAGTWRDLAREAKNLIEDIIYPSFRKLAHFVSDEYICHTRTSISAASLPNGNDYYEACLKFHTTTNLTPKEIHDIGIEEVNRITKRMEAVRDEVKFEGTLKEFRTYLRTSDKFNFKDEKEILSCYKEVCKKIEEKLPNFFHMLPKADYEVVPVSPDVAEKFPFASYIAPPDDGSRLGRFNINTYKPATRKRYDVTALCLHEAMPGHHLQICLTMERGLCPDFRRLSGIKRYSMVPAYFAMNTAYLEGWGLYCEYLGEEMGFYTDAFDMFGRLSSEMLRACRLVVDTGIHAFGWSREQAIQYMMDNTASDIHVISFEVNRYITAPGQACGYKIGELKIKELRKKAEKCLGDAFNLKLFHHTVACLGAVPLDTLEEQVDRFINEILAK